MRFASLVCIALLVTYLAPRLPADTAHDDDREASRSLAGFELSEAALIEDGLPFTWSDEVVLRLIHRVSRMPPAAIHQLAQPLDAEQLQRLVAEPSQSRLKVFYLTARVHSVELAPPRAGELAELPQAYLCELSIGGTPARAVVTKVPEVLIDRTDLDEPVSLFAFFVRLNNEPVEAHEIDRGVLERERGAAPSALFVANRLSWHPQRLEARWGLDEGLCTLARFGFDVGWVDVIRRQNRRPLNRADQPALVAMVRATAAMDGFDPALPWEGSGIDLMPLIRDPDAHIGAWVDLEGNVRRITPWELSDDLGGPKLALLQLDLFAPLGDGSVRLRGSDGQEVVFRGRFPVTCHVPSDLAAGESWVGRRVRVQGFFYRFWSYESALSHEQGFAGGQLSPLILAVRVTPIVVDEAVVERWLTWIMMGLISLVVALVVAYTWMDRRPLRRLPDQLTPPEPMP